MTTATNLCDCNPYTLRKYKPVYWMTLQTGQLPPPDAVVCADHLLPMLDAGWTMRRLYTPIAEALAEKRSKVRYSLHQCGLDAAAIKFVMGDFYPFYNRRRADIVRHGHVDDDDYRRDTFGSVAGLSRINREDPRHWRERDAEQDRLREERSLGEWGQS